MLHIVHCDKNFAKVSEFTKCLGSEDPVDIVVESATDEEEEEESQESVE